MQIQNKYEILEGLPTSGPMYIPISEDGVEFYHEGLVVRFFKDDGTNWVANFKTGWTKYRNVFEIPNTDKIVVIANGQGYIMTPAQQKPVSTFGYAITDLIPSNDGRFIAVDITDLVIINNDATVWRSQRISWDGIEELNVNNNIVTGLSYDPMHDSDEWVNFSFNLDTKEITGGSYNRYQFEESKKPFWKFW
ncbi:MAG: hypothetical protein E6H07_16065 [Bacteroidetes bacterium]|nr:MAG: hypothetical protein E6H07_16065 [Bacteroidota bacterium]